MPRKKKGEAILNQGVLIIIGGREDKKDEMLILSEVAKRVGRGKLVIATIASTLGDELWEEYVRIFKKLGVKKVSHLDVSNRHKDVVSRALKSLNGANSIFFTGGDQLRITSELGGTPIVDRIFDIYHAGGLIAGTSAGASAMSETMLVSGTFEASFRIGASLRMAPGLGFARSMIIDQHFAERGRISRLIGAIAQNPKYLGVGIDENTAIIVESEESFRVIGDGAVYVLDAHGATDSNISEAQQDVTLSIFNVRFHVLSAGDVYNVVTKRPTRMGTMEEKKVA